MVRGISYMFVTGPSVVKTVTHEEVDFEGLGGADPHGGTSGVAHFVHDAERDSLAAIRTLLSYLPSNNLDDPPIRPSTDPADRRDEELLDVVPDEAAKPYDMHDVIRRVVDDGVFFEVHRDFAGNLLVGFARLGGGPVGVVANQPAALAGVLDISASLKGARFIRFCDAFNIPLVTFEDVPGFLPGVAQEHGGIIKHGAKLLYAYCEATVPKLTVITRKAYGGAYDVMNSKHVRGDYNVAWPTAEIAVMGPKGAVEILYKDDATEAREREYREKFAHPYLAAARGYVDDIIDPRDTRPRLIDALATLARAAALAWPLGTSAVGDSARVLRVGAWALRSWLAWESGGVDAGVETWGPLPIDLRLPPVLDELGENLLRACPAGGVLLTAGDADFYAAWYMRFARGLRPDLLVLPLAAWRSDAVLRARLMADLKLGRRGGGDDAWLAELVRRRPVCVSMAFDRPPETRPRIRWETRPLVWVAGPEGKSPRVPPRDFVFGALRVALDASDPWAEPALAAYSRAARATPTLCDALATFKVAADVPTCRK